MDSGQVSRWQLQQAAGEAAKGKAKKAAEEDVHALLPAHQDEPDPETASEDIFAELGVGDPLLLVGASPGGPPQGAFLRRSDSQRSTGSRRSSSKSPPRMRQVHLVLNL